MPLGSRLGGGPSLQYVTRRCPGSPRWWSRRSGRPVRVRARRGVELVALGVGVGLLARVFEVAVSWMLISWEAIAKADGVWSGMPGFLDGLCGGICVRGVCGG